MRNNTYFILIVVLCFSFAACKNNKKPKSGKWNDTITTGLISIAVDESFEPIISTQIDVFETVYARAGIIPMYTTEKEALELLFEDSVRLAIVSRGLTEGEIKAYHNKKRFPKEWKIATDAVALIVNKSNPDSVISVKTLKEILTGKISKWTDINPKSPLKGDITVVFDHKESGTVRYAVDSICRGEPLSANLFAEKKHSEVIDYVTESPHAIGVIGVDWVGNPRDTSRLSFNERVTVMAVSKFDHASPANSYKPYQAYIALKQYPLTRDVYAILNDPRGGLSSGFTSFLCSQRGQYIILKSGLVPATQPVRIVEVTK